MKSAKKTVLIVQFMALVLIALGTLFIFSKQKESQLHYQELTFLAFVLNNNNPPTSDLLNSETVKLDTASIKNHFNGLSSLVGPILNDVSFPLDRDQYEEKLKVINGMKEEALSNQRTYLYLLILLLSSMLIVVALITREYFTKKYQRFIGEKADTENGLRRKAEEWEQKAKAMKNTARKFKGRWAKVLSENTQLHKKVEEADSVQREMKEFVDTQIKTNEQLMIAENQLKNLLEKEKESKSIINQTLDRLKDTQGQLVHSEKMASLGQLTAGIAHEINNPINFVFNGIGSLRSSLDELSEVLDKYAELDNGGDAEKILTEVKGLKEDLEYSNLREDLDELIVDIKEGAVRTIEIVKGLRVFSRLDEEDRKDANINECLDATLILLKNKTKNRISVVKDLNPDIPDISCFPGQLNQVFMNIINNAIQAIPEEQKNAEIAISTEEDKESIFVKLKDNGTGMSEEVMQRIFEPFFTTKPVGVGTGLGMSISYGIIEKHHGTLDVQSELGKGTEFIIKLPKLAPAEYSKAI